MTDEPHHHLPPQTLRAYREGRTDPAETLAVSDALAVCAECRQMLAALDPAPAYEELAAAADGSLEPVARATLLTRLTDHPAATAELADLEAFRRELQSQHLQIFGPSTRTVQPAPAMGKVTPTWTRDWRFPVLGAIAAALLLLAVLWRPALAPDSEKARLLTDPAGHHADLAALPVEVRSAVEDALSAGRLQVSPALAALRPTSDTLAGLADEVAFQALSPVGVVTRDSPPTLRWTHRDGAAGYVVTLMALDGDHPWTSGELHASQKQWIPPHPLTPGAIYLWQVEALRGGEVIDRAPKPPAPEARFQVLDDARRAELARLQQRYHGFPLVMAAALTRAGLIDESAQWLDRLAHEHPESPLAQRLRRGTESAVPARPVP